jgi:hypothetical protein
MDVDSFSRRERMLKLRKTLLRAQENRLSGKPGRTIEETVTAMRQAVLSAATRPMN